MLKRIVITLVAVFGVLLAVPTIFPSSAKYFPSWIQPISLGLDLKGGAQLLLEVDTDTMMRENQFNYMMAHVLHLLIVIKVLFVFQIYEI